MRWLLVMGAIMQLETKRIQNLECKDFRLALYRSRTSSLVTPPRRYSVLGSHALRISKQTSDGWQGVDRTILMFIKLAIMKQTSLRTNQPLAPPRF